MLDASVLRACACFLSTKEETRTLCALAPAWSRSSWLTSREPREVCLALISPPLASQPGEAALEEVLCHPPREAWPLARRTTPRPVRGSASSGWLLRGGEFYARCTSRGSADVSHDDQGQAGANGRSVPVSCSMRRRQASGVVSQGISQRFPFWCNKTKTASTAGWWSSPSPPQRHD